MVEPTPGLLGPRLRSGPCTTNDSPPGMPLCALPASVPWPGLANNNGFGDFEAVRRTVPPFAVPTLDQKQGAEVQKRATLGHAVQWEQHGLLWQDGGKENLTRRLGAGRPSGSSSGSAAAGGSGMRAVGGKSSGDSVTKAWADPLGHAASCCFLWASRWVQAASHKGRVGENPAGFH